MVEGPLPASARAAFEAVRDRELALLEPAAPASALLAAAAAQVR